MMSVSDNDPDRMIRRALAEEEAELPWSVKDPSMTSLLTETFRGRNRFLAMGGVVANIVLLGVALLSVTRFLGTGDVREMLLWGSAALLCVVLILAVKIWYWLEMARLSLTRDIKRLELRVSRLAEKLQEPENPRG
jgi:hypothetical protein